MLIEDVDDDRPDACFSVVFRDCRQISLYENRTVAQGFQGWATVLCTHSTHYGRWYWEVDVIEAPAETALRVGAAIRYCRYDMPLGYNDFSGQHGDCTQAMHSSHVRFSTRPSIET